MYIHFTSQVERLAFQLLANHPKYCEQSVLESLATINTLRQSGFAVPEFIDSITGDFTRPAPVIIPEPVTPSPEP